MVDVFRPVSDNIILPRRIMLGQSYKNYSFCKNATIQDYKNVGLYHEVGSKPTPEPYCVVQLESETINHYNKEIELTWKQVPMSYDQCKSIYKQEMIDDLDTGYTYKGVVYQCQEQDINSFNLGMSMLAVLGLETITCRS